jgi:hypothetical protein
VSIFDVNDVVRLDQKDIKKLNDHWKEGGGGVVDGS